VRICIYGAGASGGHFAVRLAEAGHAVSIVARGDHLAAVRERGLTLRRGQEEHVATVAASDIPADFGVQDCVLVTVKATALGAIAAGLAPLIGPRTIVVFAQNGMPWWYPHGLEATFPTPPDLPIFHLAAAFFSLLRRDQVIGGMIYSANAVVAPGVIVNASPGRNRLDVAPIEGGDTERVRELRGILDAAGIASPTVFAIREAVWRKLLINMTGSTIALATANRSSISRTDPWLGDVYLRALHEGLSICAAHCYPLDGSVDPVTMQAQLNDHKPSLLQDYEAGRPMEIGEIVLAPLAFARSRAIDTPTLDTLAAIVRRLAIDRSLYRDE
jgi:2-dehydropantoate 2-reductase